MFYKGKKVQIPFYDQVHATPAHPLHESRQNTWRSNYTSGNVNMAWPVNMALTTLTMATKHNNYLTM